jgi:acetyl esterase/lipase
MRRNTQLACLLAGALFILAAPQAVAQVPADVAEKLRELGRGILVPQTLAIYAPFHTEKEPYAGVKIVRDAKYGADERQALDVFVPENMSGGPRPVLIFVHGGAFVAGNKKGPPGAFYYDNIGVWAARNGMIGVNITYRLAPVNKWPTGAQDTATAVKWVIDNIASHGGDPARIFLSGHSAGAIHVADYIAFPQFHAIASGPGIKGAIIISGAFDVARFPSGPPNKAYYGEDVSKYAERSPQPGLLKTTVPLLVAYAELDPPEFVVEAKALNEALCKAERCPRLVELAKHSHMSETFSINTGDTLLAGPIAEFVKNTK